MNSIGKSFLNDLFNSDGQITTLYHHPNDDFLFRINPKVELLNLKYPEFYLKPNTYNERLLNFDIYIETDQPGAVVFKIQTGWKFVDGEKRAVFEEIEVDASEKWISYSLKLPKSTHLVIPHKVRFESPAETAAKKILLTNISAKIL
ncbi:hypothetical protein BVY02_00800 [bacterium J17]|nr:hypothetical protein BVY02_00800 [bacterium J17]